MKITKIVLAALVAMSSVNGLAAEQTQQPITAKQALAQQYAEFADLKAQLKEAKKRSTYGKISIAVSTAALGAGLVMTFRGIAGAVAGKILGANQAQAFLQKHGSDLVVFGSLTGLVGSTAYVIYEGININDMEAQIDQVQKQIEATSAQLN